MARFYGEVESMRGFTVHRLGHSKTTVRACSWRGGVETTMYTKDDEIWVRIETIGWKGRGAYNLLFDGPLSRMQEATPERPAYQA